MLLILLGSTLVAAQGGNGTRAGTQTTSATVGNGNAGETGEGVQTQTQQRAQEIEQVQTMLQQRQQEMEQEMQGMGSGEQNAYQNQNQARLAVHAMLAMEDMVGNMGSTVSTVARQFNNSIQVTLKAEEKIQSRSGIVRFFAGGDNNAAEEINQQVIQNRNRIQELEQNMENCDCDEQVRVMLQEHIQSMEQEQNRLQQLAQSEKENKGLFGWIWKR